LLYGKLATVYDKYIIYITTGKEELASVSNGNGRKKSNKERVAEGNQRSEQNQSKY